MFILSAVYGTPHIFLISLSLKVISSHLTIKGEEFEHTDIDEADKLTYQLMC